MIITKLIPAVEVTYNLDVEKEARAYARELHASGAVVDYTNEINSAKELWVALLVNGEEAGRVQGFKEGAKVVDFVALVRDFGTKAASHSVLTGATRGKMTEDQKAEITTLANEGFSAAEIAVKVNRTEATVAKHMPTATPASV